ncbi:hypothetical protein [Roseicella frigidaeris]|uniref:Glycosyltransferase family 2 protein n=1 Tax=Roseicella frigidaeris TaxID=2230885 RepID=A0A327LYL8_9PROT|nr:hypothetical protein [Roseicella frigidaeris]RAI56011.1 hypothetical protein DOO78_23010 [Roseicella frigidaeris]
MREAKASVVVATPCFGALVHQDYMLSVIRLMRYAAEREIGLSLEMLGHDSLITRSRNTLLGRFLDTREATHLLFVDADIAFEPEQLGRMLAAEKDVVAGLYPIKAIRWDGAACARVAAGEALDTAPLLYVGTPAAGAAAERDGDFVTAEYAGTGFMLIRRAAIERMIAAYPETRYRAIHAFAPGAASRPELHALFDCVIDRETGVYLSEDFTFCRRWRAIGGKIWLDTAGRLTHVGAHDYAGQPAARYGG